MSKGAKIWIIVAVSLILIGIIIFGGVMSALKWDFTKLSTQKYENNTHEINEGFKNVQVKSDTAKIVFVMSDDGKCRVECYEEKNSKHQVTVSDETLTVSLVNEKKWYDYIGISIGTPKITIYLPKSEYAGLVIKNNTGDIEIPKDFKFDNVDISLSTGDVKNYASVSESIRIKTSTGDIHVENASVGSMDLSVSTGDITVTSVICQTDVKIKVSTGKSRITDVDCQSFTSTGDTGDINMSDTVASQKFDIKRSTGDVSLDGCDAGEIVIKTDTGSVKGTLLSEKVFIAQSDTGSVRVPKTTQGGRCEITTDTGSIKIQIQE